MKKFEKFLHSNIYPLLIAIIGFITWSLPVEFLWLNKTLMFSLIVLGLFLLAFYKNTKHIIPITLSMLFAINVKAIGIEDIKGITVYHIMLVLALTGLITHFIRFKHKLKFDSVGIGLLLVAITYVIPMVYMPYSTLLLSMSLTGFLYLFYYLFLRSTADVTTDEVLNYFFFASLQLIAIMTYSIGSNFLELIKTKPLIETLTLGLKSSWGNSDYGFGNINDLTIHLSILSSGIFYKLVKKPKNYLHWLVVILAIMMILLSGSRGGLITLTLVLLVYTVMLVVYGKKHQIVFASLLLTGLAYLMYSNSDIVKIFADNFVRGGLDDLESFSSGRISLYKEAFALFKKYPLFGAGWTTLEANNADRVLIFHSTIFHTLAITGFAGMVAVFILIISSFATLLKKVNMNVLILGLPWTMTMIHGLIDNTVHMAIFTLLTAILFTAIQKEENTALKQKKEFFKYLMIDQL